jgi:hypothetical protein
MSASRLAHQHSGERFASTFATTGLVLGAVDVAHPADDEIRKHLEEILTRPEFGAKVDDFWRRFWQTIAESLRNLSGLQDTAPIVYWFLIAACLGLLALLVIHIVWSVRRILFVGAGGTESESSAETRGRLSIGYRDEAHRQAAAGEYTEAIRFLFLSLVYRFDESGRVLFPRAYTNREYLSLFEGRVPMRSQLQVFVDALDEYWYGERTVAQEEYERCRLLYEQMR